MKKNIFINVCLFFCLSTKAQLAVSSSVTPSNLVNNVLLGPGVSAFNIQYTGALQAIGYFNGLNSNIGLKSGVLLTSGSITNAIGPNNSTNKSAINNMPGDPILTAICGQPTSDAAILEFDFIPSSDTVRFNYVFASEEYYEGVCTPYNDAFAFLLTGPGITGTANIALIPGTNKLVSISSVNGGVLGQSIYSPSTTYTYCNLSYTNFYVDNVTPPGPTVQYDGFTNVFTAKSKVIPCQIYHIKMAIADGGNDNTWDSGVFLEAGSFNTHYLTVNNQPRNIGCSVNNAAVEGTGISIVTFKRYDSIPYPRSLNYTISGSASPNDYTISSTKIYFPPGADSTFLFITPLTDNLTEGIETVSLTIIPDFIVCNGWAIPGGEVKITDPPKLNPDFSATYTTGCEPLCIQFNNITTGTTTATWSFDDGSPSVQSPAVTHCFNKGIYDIKLHVTNSQGCKDSITKNNYLTVFEKPHAEFVQRTPDLSFYNNNGIFQNASLNASTYKWFLDSAFISSARDLEYSFKDTGCCFLQLVAIDSNTCSDTTENTICVIEGFTFWMPNAFSPDKDTKNNYFFPKGTGWIEEDYTFEIYNRWGDLIFKTNDTAGQWDGNYGGTKANDEIYVWRVFVWDIYGDEHEFHGNVLIMR